MAAHKHILIEFWYLALRSPHGICIKTENRVSARVNLNAVRRESLDPDLDTLNICLSPTVADELWIVKRGRK